MTNRHFESVKSRFSGSISTPSGRQTVGETKTRSNKYSHCFKKLLTIYRQNYKLYTDSSQETFSWIDPVMIQLWMGLGNGMSGGPQRNMVILGYLFDNACIMISHLFCMVELRVRPSER